MSRYSLSPDGVLDPDAGASGSAARKLAEVVDADDFAERAQTRTGFRELDAAVEASELSRSARDAERAEPLAQVDEPGHPRMLRRLQGDGVLRRPLSSRQRKDRSRLKMQAQDAMTLTQHRAVTALATEEKTWDQLSDKLSDCAGDAQLLGDDARLAVQRIDRGIQHFEQGNRRGHVVYANLALPVDVLGTRRPEKWILDHLPAEITFDRYTSTAHCLHEIEASQQSTFALEIQTRRGMYLGRSDSRDDTRHLLPRGLRLHVRGWSHSPYERPDGSTAYRRVLQLIDVDDEPTEQRGEI